MKKACFDGSIEIKTNLKDLIAVLLQQEFISQWEKGFETFKEIHFCSTSNTVIHWDIENDLDYRYQVNLGKGGVELHLHIDRACTVCQAATNVFRPSDYINTVLRRIKNVCEQRITTAKTNIESRFRC